ncbi:MAG: DnaJ domain-containing protein [Bdellovibrionales bacterium]|nr:DnaJ domain-containing protein [Bdellovibrionales bacterium]
MSSHHVNHEPSSTHSSRDPYQILGVPKNAPWDQIKRAYKEKIRSCHPDRVEGLSQDIQKAAKKNFHEYTQAFQRLERSQNQKATNK